VFVQRAGLGQLEQSRRGPGFARLERTSKPRSASEVVTAGVDYELSALATSDFD
jgi:hypothetical protein